MKILLIHQFFILEEEPGGSRHVELLRHFANQGYQVSVIGGGVNYMTNQSKLPRGKFYVREIHSGITVMWVYAFPTLIFGVLGKLLSYFSFFVFSLPVILRENPDVILATSPPPTVAVLGWILSRLRKIPWIFEVRDLWPDFGVDLGLISPGIFYHLLDKIMRFLYKQSSCLVTLTWGLEKALYQKGVNPQKITTIPNGVDSIFFNECKRSVPELEVLKGQNKFIVMYIGALGKANQVIKLIQLACVLRDASSFHFVLTGDGSEKKHLEQSALNQGLKNVLFLEAMPRKDIPALLQYANAGIVILAKVPGFRHAISNKLFDYMASGVPVILALEEGDAWEILEKAQGGVRVDPDDLDSMKKWLVYFLEHPEEAKAMGEQGKSYVFQHFLRKDLARQYLEVIEKTAAEFQRPAVKKPEK